MVTKEQYDRHKKIEALAGQIDQMKALQHGESRFEAWRLSVGSVLEAQFGAEHRLSKRFCDLEFRSVNFSLYSRADPTPEEDQEEFAKDIATADSVIRAALDVWYNVGPIRQSGAPDGHGPVVAVTNNNAAHSASLASAHIQVQFPLDELLALVERSDALSPEGKLQATEHLEDLDGELRKTNPRWEKLNPALKFMLDTGKEIAIKTIGAVAAKMMTG